MTEQADRQPVPNGTIGSKGTSSCGDLPAIDWALDDQAFIASVLDLLTEGFVLFDDQHRFVFCNETYRAFYPKIADLFVPGTPFEELIRASSDRGQIVPLEETDQDFVSWRLEHYELASGVHEHQLCDGRWLRVSERRLKNGWVLGTRTDITEAKQRKRAQEVSEQHLFEALEALQEGFALFGPDDRLVVCNEKYKGYFPLIRDIIQPGVPFEEFIRRAAEQGQNIETIEDPELWIKARLKAHIRASGTFEHKFSDGRYVWVTERKTKDGSTLSTYVDITELKLRENELERARKIAETASRAKSDFLANMSHEFRTPLNAILGFTEVMCRQMLGPIENERYRDYLDNILDSGSHLLRMVNDLLDFEKIEARRMTLDEEIVDVTKIVASCKSMLLHRAETSGVTLYSEMPEDGPLLMIDELAIKKALINVITNAVKFTPSGGTVAITCRIVESGDVAIRVADTGIGIGKDDLERITIPFVQVGEKSIVEGTGLGLSITKSLVELHDGTLEIVSEPGCGTTVTITIPKNRVADDPTLARAASG